jgi:hypothetical protein
MQRIRDWVGQNFSGAIIEEKTYHGQLRFTVPATVAESATYENYDEITPGDTRDEFDLAPSAEGKGAGSKSIVGPFSRLEESKEGLGVQFYSVSQTTLDQVFLTIVGQHNIAEENSEQVASSKKG